MTNLFATNVGPYIMVRPHAHYIPDTVIRNDWVTKRASHILSLNSLVSETEL